jgi:hypothetical protein
MSYDLDKTLYLDEPTVSRAADVLDCDGHRGTPCFEDVQSRGS